MPPDCRKRKYRLILDHPSIGFRIYGRAMTYQDATKNRIGLQDIMLDRYSTPNFKITIQKRVGLFKWKDTI